MAANNPLLYDAAIAGMSGGVNQRWLTNPSPVAYVPIRDQIVIFATTLDAAFVADPTLTVQDAALMQAICQQIFATRWPTSNTLTTQAVASLVLAIKAMFDTMRAVLEVIPSSNTITPLSKALYVDRGSVATGTPNGSIANPFLNIQDAIDAAPAVCTIFIVNADYTDEGVLNITKNLVLNSIDFASDIQGLNIAGAAVTLKAITVAANIISDSDIGLVDSSVLGNIDIDGTLLINATQDGFVSVNGTIDCFGIFASQYVFLGNITTVNGGSNVFRRCQFNATITLTGPAGSKMDMDALTYDNFVSSESTVVGGTLPLVAEWANFDSNTLSYQEDFDYKGIGSLAVVGTGGVNIPLGRGSWAGFAITTSGSAVTNIAPVQNHPGQFGLRTSTTINSAVILQRGEVASLASGSFRADEFECTTMILKLLLVTSGRLQAGIQSSPLVMANAMAFVFDSSVSPNWFAVCRNTSVETAVDTGVVAAANTYYYMHIRQSGTHVYFYLGLTKATAVLVADINTNVPAGATALNHSIFYQTLVAAAREFQVDYIDFQSPELDR